MEFIRLNVLRSNQKGQVIYTGFIDPEIAKLITFTDDYPPEQKKIGYQRPPIKKRINDFTKYLEQDSSSFVTPILLNSRFEFSFQSIIDDYGYVELPIKQCLAIVDGQHRTLGTIQFKKNSIPIPFMLFHKLDIDFEQELFITINREQKKVSMSHVKYIDRENDPISQIAIKLEQDPLSPWYQSVNLVGARGTKRAVSLDSLGNSLKELLQAGEIKVLNIDQQYNIAKEFWEVISLVWPEAWNAPKNSLLRKAMGTLAVSKLGGYLLPQCLEKGNTIKINKEKLYCILSKAKNVNWMNNGDFKGISGRHGAVKVKETLDSLIYSEGQVNV